MDKATFSEVFNRISAENRIFAAKYVTNHLPDSYRYFVHLNQSFDENPLKPGEHVFPKDSNREGEAAKAISAAEVVGLLWRNGLIPEWIDISVHRADVEHTYFELLCCGRFTADDSMLYYRNSGQGPFGCKSPRFPPNWSEQQGSFDLNWHLKR